MSSPTRIFPGGEHLPLAVAYGGQCMTAVRKGLRTQIREVDYDAHFFFP